MKTLGNGCCCAAVEPLTRSKAATDTKPFIGQTIQKNVGKCWVYPMPMTTIIACRRPARSDGRWQNQLYALAWRRFMTTTTSSPTSPMLYSGIAPCMCTKSGNGWQLINRGKPNHIGAYGEAPRGKDWTFHQFGLKTYGYLATHSDMHHGYAGSHYAILSPWKQGVASSWLGAAYNSEGASENGKTYADLEATFYINTKLAHRRHVSIGIQSAQPAMVKNSP